MTSLSRRFEQCLNTRIIHRNIFWKNSAAAEQKANAQSEQKQACGQWHVMELWFDIGCSVAQTWFGIALARGEPNETALLPEK